MVAVVDDLLNSLSVDAPVRFVWVGVHWTVVGSHRCGMAASLMASHLHGEPQVRQAGQLITQSARELAELVRSDRPLEASIGLAAINSLLDMDVSQATEENAVEVLLNRGRDKNVALVGRFAFAPQVRRVARRLWVLELQPAADEYPAEAAPDLLPQADVIAITASTLINHTLDGLLALCPPRATVMLIGPSTPFSPVLFDHGVDILSGARVVDEQAVLRTVGEGATFHQVQGVRLLTLQKDRA